jgi:hypothetical protein
MPLPNEEERRPLDKGGAHKMTSPTKSHPSLTDRPGITAEEMQRALELCADAWEPYGEHMHRLGFERGYRVGWLAGQREEHDGWLAVLGACRKTMQQPTAVELVVRRAADRACRCEHCSACARRAAMQRNRARYGTDNYPGEVAS